MTKRSRFFLSLIIIALLGLMISEPNKYMSAAMDGLNIVVYKVFPSMFPFFIITKLLTLLGFGVYVSKIVSKPIGVLYNTSSMGGYILAMSMLSGYPIGAKMISEFAKTNLLSKNDAECIMAFSSCSGPIFILGTIGIGMFNDFKAGIIILISHLVATLFNGIIFRSNTKIVNDVHIDLNSNESFFNDAISSSITAFLQVGASIIFLSVVIEAINPLINVIATFSNTIGIMPDLLKGIMIGGIEMTKGISFLSASTIDYKIKIVASATIISFGGISILLQSMMFLSKIGVTTKYYLTTKLSQAVLTFMISSILVLIF